MRVNTAMRDLTEAPLWTRMLEADRWDLFASAAGRLRARRIGQSACIHAQHRDFHSWRFEISAH